MRASLAERMGWTLYLAKEWRGQSSFPFRSTAAIERAQSRRVRSMMDYAYTTVPYYRETMNRIALRPSDFRHARDLARLPIIEREQLQRDPEYFESTAGRRGRDIEFRSGGSTGAPRLIKWNTAAIFQNAGHAERERSIIAELVGSFTGYRESVITSLYGGDSAIQELYKERAILPSRARVQYQSLTMFDSPEKNVELLNEFRPDVIRGYGSYLDRLFSWVHQTGAEFHRPKVVFYDADELPMRARRLITDEMGIEVLSAYQAVEAFKVGFECASHTGIHLNTDIYPLRVVDDSDNDVGVGISGKVIVSNLVNRATVLLNYRLGDVAHLVEHDCPCGRTLPLLSYIEGRIDDWITVASGEVVHPQTIRTIFTYENSVRQYQVVQERLDRFTAAMTTFDADSGLEERIRGRFAERFGETVDVEVRFVDSIEPNAGGKLRTVISLLDRPAS